MHHVSCGGNEFNFFLNDCFCFGEKVKAWLTVLFWSIPYSPWYLVLGSVLCYIFGSSTLVAFLSHILIDDSSSSDYYLDSGDAYDRSGGRRSSLYEGESGHDHRDPAGDFNRSAYGFNTSRSVSNPSIRCSILPCSCSLLPLPPPFICIQ